MSSKVTLKAEVGQETKFHRLMRPNLGAIESFGECRVGLLLPGETLDPYALDTLQAQLGVLIMGARASGTGILLEAEAPSQDADRLGGELYQIQVTAPNDRLDTLQETFRSLLQGDV